MDSISLKSGAVSYPSRVIQNSKGNILHGMKRSDIGFVDFGEAYFSMVSFGEIKGWKKHFRMSMNLLVPVGSVRFYLQSEDDDIEQLLLGENNYRRLFVPPGIWMAFEGVGRSTNLLMNLASIEHDPSESITREFER